MRRAMSFALSVVLLAACAHNGPRTPATDAAARAGFEQELLALAETLTIPGIAYAVVAEGEVIASGAVSGSEGAPLTVDTPLRFASVTKALTAVMLMRAVETGRVSLDDRASAWAPDLGERADITLRHLAAHVSEGAPGDEYVYGTNRYAKLGGVLAAAYGAPNFEAALRAEIVQPLGMTWHESPYLGAHAGFVSTVEDMARFAAALQDGALLSEGSFAEMIAPYRAARGGDELPVGVGWFTQEIGGERVIWSFGQDDPEHSSALLLLVPARDVGVVVLANTDELSNPFRLLMGNIRDSPFATAFLDAFVPDIGAGVSVRDRMISRMMIAAWTEDAEVAGALFDAIAALGPPSGDDFALHFVASHLVSTERRGFCEALDAAIMAAHPTNRWALLMSGGLKTALGEPQAAAARYETLLGLENQEPDFLARLFQAWAHGGLAEIYLHAEPLRALEHARAGVATGVDGETLERLQAIVATLES